tara:strand:+ start:586 stop:738 length:153 start_codon:yes stop_codon:yes gene_type:complete
MRTGWHFETRRPVLKLGFKLAHHLGIKHVLDEVGVPVNVTGSNVGITNQI